MTDRFVNWEYPEIIEGEPTRYHWIVQGIAGFYWGIKPISGRFAISRPEKGW